MGVNDILAIFEKSSEDRVSPFFWEADILLSLVTSEELSYKVNPLRRTEVPAKNLFSFHSEDGGKVCSGLADLSCVFLNRARGNMRQGPWRHKISYAWSWARMQELLRGWVGIQIVTQA